MNLFTRRQSRHSCPNSQESARACATLASSSSHVSSLQCLLMMRSLVTLLVTSCRRRGAAACRPWPPGTSACCAHPAPPASLPAWRYQVRNEKWDTTREHPCHPYRGESPVVNLATETARALIETQRVLGRDGAIAGNLRHRQTNSEMREKWTVKIYLFTSLVWWVFIFSYDLLLLSYQNIDRYVKFVKIIYQSNN